MKALTQDNSLFKKQLNKYFTLAPSAGSLANESHLLDNSRLKNSNCVFEWSKQQQED